MAFVYDRSRIRSLCLVHLNLHEHADVLDGRRSRMPPRVRRVPNFQRREFHWAVDCASGGDGLWVLLQLRREKDGERRVVRVCERRPIYRGSADMGRVFDGVLPVRGAVGERLLQVQILTLLLFIHLNLIYQFN